MALPSRNFLPGSPTGMQTQTTPGTSTSTQANVPKDWADIYASMGLGGIGAGGGSGSGAQVGAIGSATSGPFGDYSSGADMSLSDQSASSSGGGSWSTGGAATAGAGAGRKLGGVSSGISSATGAGSGSKGSGSSGGGGGGSIAGLAAAFGSSPNPGPAVGMDAGGSDPLDVAPPTAAGPQIGAASQGAGNTTQMAAPGGLRPGMGSRIYPALNALLKSPAY